MPTLAGLGLPNENSTIPELIDHIAMLHKTIEYYIGNLDSKNVREIGGWQVGDDMLASTSGNVGLSTATIAGSGLDIRMWAGSTDMDTAAFRVYESGKLVATNAQITGGTISWGAVGAPLFTDILGPKPTIDADNTASKLPESLGINYTKIGSTYIYTGTLNANQINAGTIVANYIKGGEISGVDINVSNDITVGNNIYFKPSDTAVAVKSLNFGGRGSLDFRSNVVRLSGISVIDLQASSVTLNDAPIATQAWVNSNVTAKYG